MHSHEFPVRGSRKVNDLLPPRRITSYYFYHRSPFEPSFARHSKFIKLSANAPASPPRPLIDGSPPVDCESVRLSFILGINQRGKFSRKKEGREFSSCTTRGDRGRSGRQIGQEQSCSTTLRGSPSLRPLTTRSSA